MPGSLERVQDRNSTPGGERVLWKHDGAGGVLPAVYALLSAYSSADLAFIDLAATNLGELKTTGGGGGGSGGVVTQGARDATAAYWLVRQQPAGTSSISRVNDSATSAQLLASNANRLGAVIQNDSDKDLYVKYGTTASATDYTIKLGPGDAWVVDDGYTGRIDGIWSADSTGAAQITELTA